jgi:hypothetical protein
MSESKVEEKKPEAKEAPKPVAKKKVAKKSAGPSDPTGTRSIVSVAPSQLKAVVSIGEKKYKVTRHMKRSTGEWLLAVPGGKSVLESDWLEGKATIGLEG